MTKKMILKALHGEYMDALAFFASKIADAEDMEEAVEKLDNRVWKAVEDDDEAEEMWLYVYSALLCAC